MTTPIRIATPAPTAPSLWRRAARLAAVAAFGFALSVGSVAPWSDAEAAPKAGFGSRGSRTYQAPPSTQTAPNTAGPIERTATPRPGNPGAVQPGPTGAAPGGLFGGLGGSMFKGLLIGGLVGMLLGHGLGGAAGLLGLLLQAAIIGFGIWFVMRLIRGRQQQPGYAGPQNEGLARQDQGPGMFGGGSPLGGAGPQGGPSVPQGLGQAGGYGLKAGPMQDAAPIHDAPAPYAPAASGPNDAIGLTGEDFDAFERLLAEVQTAFGRGDVEELKTLTTPEAHRFLSENLDELAQSGLVNEIRDVKLLQGDLAEAWNEGSVDYASVAMRYAMIDVTRERSSGRVVEGNAAQPTEFTQVWTFMRERGFAGRPGLWRLSAMQDAA